MTPIDPYWLTASAVGFLWQDFATAHTANFSNKHIGMEGLKAKEPLLCPHGRSSKIHREALNN
jgi:hypothetical protein